MKHKLVLIIVGCLLWQVSAYARYRNETVTPTNTVTSELIFQVSVEDQGNFAFTVTITPSTSTILSTDLHPALIVQDSEGALSQCPVRTEIYTNSVSCYFTLYGRALTYSYLHVSTGHSIQGYDTDGIPSGGKIAVGTIYRVNLGEFVKENPEQSVPAYGAQSAPSAEP